MKVIRRGLRAKNQRKSRWARRHLPSHALLLKLRQCRLLPRCQYSASREVKLFCASRKSRFFCGRGGARFNARKKILAQNGTAEDFAEILALFSQELLCLFQVFADFFRLLIAGRNELARGFRELLKLCVRRVRLRACDFELALENRDVGA